MQVRTVRTVSDRVTISVGGATLTPSPTTTATDLLEVADANLLTAKRDGRNRYRTNARAQRTLSIALKLDTQTAAGDEWNRQVVSQSCGGGRFGRRRVTQERDLFCTYHQMRTMLPMTHV